MIVSQRPLQLCLRSGCCHKRARRGGLASPSHRAGDGEAHSQGAAHWLPATVLFPATSYVPTSRWGGEGRSGERERKQALWYAFRRCYSRFEGYTLMTYSPPQGPDRQA